MIDAPILAHRTAIMTDTVTYGALIAAVERYFELMFDYDVDRFGEVFAPTAQLHGLRDGALRILTADQYRALLAAGPSSESKNAPRSQAILLIDFASASQALVKVRVRIDATMYVDYLSFHRIDNAWLITAKSFHIDGRF
jgi:hypothetical protein